MVYTVIQCDAIVDCIGMSNDTQNGTTKQPFIEQALECI